MKDFFWILRPFKIKMYIKLLTSICFCSRPFDFISIVVNIDVAIYSQGKIRERYKI